MSLLIVLSAPFPFKIRLGIGGIWSNIMLFGLDKLCSLSHEIEGLDNIPDDPYIVMSKHQSTWETISFVNLFFPYVWILKKELMYLPIFGWALLMLKPIAINRKAGRKAVEQIIEQGQQRLDDGLSVVVFPEGTRVDPRKKVKFRIGGAILAENTRAKVIPVAHNAGEFWQRRKFLIFPGKIQVHIGEPIDTNGKTASEILAEVEAWMTEHMAIINERYDQTNPRKYVL